MKSYKSLLFLSLVPALALASCYHEFPGGGGGGTPSNVSLSFTLVADTPPANLGLVSFKVVPIAITLTSATGSTTIDINNGNGYSYDLVRLQSDAAFLGTSSTVPTGTITNISVTFSGATLAFFNGTGAALTSPSCPANDICIVTFDGPFTASFTTSQTIAANGGLGIDINLANTLSLVGTTLSPNFAATNAASAFTLPRDTNLASGQLELIEDYTGIVSISGSNVTITPGPIVGRPALTALTVSGTTNYDSDPTGTLCTGAPTSLSACFTSTNEAASMDAILLSNGTFQVQEIEPLLASPVVDTVEGTVVSINSNQTQFEIVATDIIPAASNSKIGSLTLDAPLVVNLSNSPTFLVDTKGLAIGATSADFDNATTTSVLRLGQNVAVKVTAFTAAVGTTPASATVDAVTLRWSRFIATPTGSSTPGLFNVNTLPGYFGFTSSSVFPVSIFTGTPGADGVTNLDGITNGNAPGTTPVGIRALFIENATNTETPAPFLAAKIRQH